MKQEEQPIYQGPADFRNRLNNLLEAERIKRGYSNHLVLLNWARILFNELELIEKDKFFKEVENDKNDPKLLQSNETMQPTSRIMPRV